MLVPDPIVYNSEALMQLKTYIEELLVGELSQANIAKIILPHIDNLNPDPSQVTVPPTYPVLLGKLVGAINRGLTQIYSELPLAEEELILITNPQTDRYLLTAKHAVYAGAAFPDMKWIDDTKYQPFQDNVIECLQVIGEDGIGFPINDSMAEASVFLPSPKIIQVPFAEDTISLSILYRASHPKILHSASRNILQPDSSSGYIMADTEMQLPDFLTNALTYFILSKYHKSIGSVEAIAQGQAHEMSFINAIQLIKNSQLLHGDFTQINNLADSGWV